MIIGSIQYLDRSYKLKVPLNCKYGFTNDAYFLDSDSLGIYAQGKTSEEALCLFSEEFDFIYQRYNELPNDKLTSGVITIKNLLNIIVEK